MAHRAAQIPQLVTLIQEQPAMMVHVQEQKDAPIQQHAIIIPMLLATMHHVMVCAVV